MINLDMFQLRARILRGTRRFFDECGYWEADTPLLAPRLLPETCLEVFKTEYVPPTSGRRGKELYLVPSPEIWLKKLIARYRVNIYQLGKCFRNSESHGPAHSPEFTMLEYYTMDADYLDSLAITEALFDALLDDEALQPLRGAGRLQALRPPFMRLTMESAFEQFAGFSLNAALAGHSLERHARALGIDAGGDISEADWYNLIFIHAVEPELRGARPVALLDYPAVVNCLAERTAGNDLTRQRWELYADGLEIANCYSEQRSAAEVRRYIEVEGAAKRQTARVPHHIESEYAEHFRHFPRCSGVALGFDRLLMALTGQRTIESVLPAGATAIDEQD